MVAVTCSPEDEAEVDAWREEHHVLDEPAATNVWAEPEKLQATQVGSKGELTRTHTLSA